MSTSVEKQHEKIEQRFIIRKCPEYADLVCPAHALETSFDGWFALKEAYSSKLVETLLKEIKNDQDVIIIDPFSGTRSTLVGARNARASKGIGIEINPFFQLLEKAKMTPVDTLKVRKEIKIVLKNAFSSKIDIDPPKLEIIGKVFEENLQPILRVKSEIEKMNDENIRDFMMAGLGCILEKVGTSVKDGNGLKYPGNKIKTDVRESLVAQYRRMLIDMSMLQNKHFDHEIVKGDCRNVSLPDRDVTHCIFSPPYANCFDYTEVYKVELWTLEFVKDYDEMKILRERSLSSHLNKQYSNVDPPRIEIKELIDSIEWEKTWGKAKNRNMLSSYFNDMKSVFLKMNGAIVENGFLACIVGNSAYGGVVIPTDLFLSLILEDCGFSVKEIRVTRKLKTSSQQTKRLKYNNYLRESIVVARKN